MRRRAVFVVSLFATAAADECFCSRDGTLTAARASLVMFKLPETGSTWAAGLIAQTGINFRHQLFKGHWERGGVEGRAAWLDLAVRCAVRTNRCYSAGNVRDKCLGGTGEKTSCAEPARPRAAVRGFSFNPVDAQRPDLTASALCAAMRWKSIERLLVVYVRANVVKSAVSGIVKAGVHRKSMACTKCGQVQPSCVPRAPLVDPRELLDLSRLKLNKTRALVAIADAACWPTMRVTYEALQLDAKGTVVAILDRLLPTPLRHTLPRRRKLLTTIALEAKNSSARESLRARLGNFDAVAAYFDRHADPCMRHMLHSPVVQARFEPNCLDF